MGVCYRCLREKYKGLLALIFSVFKFEIRLNFLGEYHLFTGPFHRTFSHRNSTFSRTSPPFHIEVPPFHRKILVHLFTWGPFHGQKKWSFLIKFLVENYVCWFSCVSVDPNFYRVNLLMPIELRIRARSNPFSLILRKHS